MKPTMTEEKTVSRNLGPLGLGDPEDISLRKVEVDVKIAQKVRDKSRITICSSEVQEFNNCVSEYPFSFFLFCHKEKDSMKQCLAKGFHDKEIWKECTTEYLNERSEYRKTGVPVNRYQRISH